MLSTFKNSYYVLDLAPHTCEVPRRCKSTLMTSHTTRFSPNCGNNPRHPECIVNALPGQNRKALLYCYARNLVCNWWAWRVRNFSADAVPCYRRRTAKMSVLRRAHLARTCGGSRDQASLVWRPARQAPAFAALHSAQPDPTLGAIARWGIQEAEVAQVVAARYREKHIYIVCLF